MNWKELFKGISITFMGIFLLFFGSAFYLVGNKLYGSDASLIWAGGMLVLMSVQLLVNYYIELWEETKNDR